MATKHRLRRSCAFCRARKIRCSNDTICKACRRQGADCIYDFEPPRPKTRGSTDSTRPNSISLRHATLLPLASAKDSSVAMNPLAEEPCLSEDIENVATVLERSFCEYSAGKTSSQSPHHQRLGEKPAEFSSILSLLTLDLIGLSATQHGLLGCSHVEEGGATFFLSGMESDNTPTMFDSTPPSATNPVTEYGQRQQTQLIDVWYSSHPLSSVVSKTLLLRELREGTHDEALLAVIMAEANFTIGGASANTRGRALLQHAQSKLRHRPLQMTRNTGVVTDSGTVVYSGVSTRIYDIISTVQVLTLLGWNAMTQSQFRRAMTYIQLAGRLATDLKRQVVATDGVQLSSRINGIDVYDVEKELIDCLYWATYSLILWVYMQTGRSYFSSPSPMVIALVLVPPTDDASATIQLDLVSENLNTLQNQKLAVREMWPLAHIAISAAHACGFHSQQEGLVSLDPMQRCYGTSQFLVETTHDLNKERTSMVSTAFALTAYHALAIQLLFPALNGQEVARTDIVGRLCYSMEEILQIFDVVSVQPGDALNMKPSIRSFLPAIFGLALDTCSRALRAIRGKRQPSGIVNEFPSIEIYTQTLQTVARRLYITSKSEFLNQSSGLRTIRKQLRISMREMPLSRASRPSSSSSGESESSTLSSASTDDLSTATTPRMDGQGPSIASDKANPASSKMLADNNAFIADGNVPKEGWQSTKTHVANTAATQGPAYTSMDINALGVCSREELSISGMVELQHSWLGQMAPLTHPNADMGEVQWDWAAPSIKQETAVPPAALWPDMNMVL